MTAPQMTESARRDLVVVDWACGVAKIMLEGNPADFGAAVRRGCEIAIAMSRRDIRAEVREEYEGKIEVADARCGICHNMLRYIAFVLTGDETADVQLAADRAKTEIDRLVALLPTTTPEGTDEAT